MSYFGPSSKISLFFLRFFLSDPFFFWDDRKVVKNDDSLPGGAIINDLVRQKINFGFWDVATHFLWFVFCTNYRFCSTRYPKKFCANLLKPKMKLGSSQAGRILTTLRLSDILLVKRNLGLIRTKELQVGDWKREFKAIIYGP